MADIPKKRTVLKKPSQTKLTETLIENNILLQRKLIDVVEAINKLVHQNEEMLGIFKEASKHVNDIEVKDEGLRPLIKKLDELLEQNRTIARGLLLLEKYTRERAQPSPGMRPPGL